MERKRCYPFAERRKMGRKRTIPEGRRKTIFLGVNAEILKRLDQVREIYAECSQMSDGQLVKWLALRELERLT